MVHHRRLLSQSINLVAKCPLFSLSSKVERHSNKKLRIRVEQTVSSIVFHIEIRRSRISICIMANINGKTKKGENSAIIIQVKQDIKSLPPDGTMDGHKSDFHED